MKHCKIIQIQTHSSAGGLEGLNLLFDTEKMKDVYGENITYFQKFDMVAMVTEK